MLQIGDVHSASHRLYIEFTLRVDMPFCFCAGTWKNNVKKTSLEEVLAKSALADSGPWISVIAPIMALQSKQTS